MAGTNSPKRASEFLHRQVRFVKAERHALGFVDLAHVHLLAASTLSQFADEHPEGGWDRGDASRTSWSTTAAWPPLRTTG